MCLKDVKLESAKGEVPLASKLGFQKTPMTVKQLSRTMSEPQTPSTRLKHPAVRQHDLFNTVALPVVGMIAVFGLVGVLHYTTVTQIFAG